MLVAELNASCRIDKNIFLNFTCVKSLLYTCIIKICLFGLYDIFFMGKPFLPAACKPFQFEKERQTIFFRLFCSLYNIGIVASVHNFIKVTL